MNLKKKYLSSAAILLLSSVIVKIIGAIYKIPLTSFIGGVGRGYFAYAYNIIMPIHTITMGALPVALSKLTSSYIAKNNYTYAQSLKKNSFKLFSAVGFIGMAIILALAKPYSNYIASSPKAIYTIVALAPSVLFSCMAASYRGYYEGTLNMVPTSVSQTIEALFKMIFGLVFAKLTVSFLYSEYESFGTILGKQLSDSNEALSIIYPYSSASAIFGATIGSLVSLIYLIFYSKLKYEYINKSKLVKTNSELLRFSFPIMISCATQSVFQFFDTSSIKIALDKADASLLALQLSQALKYVDVSQSDLTTYAYGVISSALDFKNLLTGITMALGVCAVPVISRANDCDDSKKYSYLVNSIFKYTIIISYLGGLTLYFCSSEILSLFYSSSSPDLVVACNNLVKLYSITIPIYSIAGLSVFSVQAIGRSEKSIPSYIASGVIRIMLNMILITNERFMLYGVIISGGVGYLIISIWNIVLLIKYSKYNPKLFHNYLLPIVLCFAEIYALLKLQTIFDFNSNLIYMLLLKGGFVVIIYIILCFFCADC